MRWTCVLLLSLLLAGTARAQVTPPGPSTFRAGVDVVALNVIVTDGQQQPVTGLDAGDFAVFEDGIRQELSFFAAASIPLDLAILLDTSASMTDKIDTMKQAAIGFASTLRRDDRVIVVDIKDGAKIVAPLAGDVAAASRAILSTSARGGTALYNGLYLTIKEMARHQRHSSDVRRQAIVVLSDGEDTSSLMSFDDVLLLAKESGIAIYTIQLKSKHPTPSAIASRQKYFSQSDYAMKAFAQETGARAFFPAAIDELAGVYGVIAEELATQYSLGYTSKNPKKDGAYRRVVVRVADPAGARTRTRSGYFAARPEARPAGTADVAY